MSILQEIKQSLRSANNPVKQLILVNVAVFLMVGLFNLVLLISGAESSPVHKFMLYLMLPASLPVFITQPWSLFTYLFLHDNFFHILFNMLWLYWLGGLLLEYIGKRKFKEAFFGGGIFGGLMYVFMYNVIPAFQLQLPATYALGASAGILSVVVATATLLPDYSVQLLFFGNVKLKWIALASVILDLISIPNGNAGGHIAHLGGALFGFLYIRFLYKYGGHLIPDRILHLFKRKENIQIHFRSGTKPGLVNQPSQSDIDSILDKISKSGYDSLTKKEKETLFKASKD